MKKILFFLILSGLAWAAYGQTPYDTVNVYDPQNFVEMTTIDTANGQIMSRKNNLNRRVNFHTLKKYATPDVFATWVNTVFDSVGNSSTYYDYFVTDSTGKTWYIDDIGRGKLLYDINQGNGLFNADNNGDTVRVSTALLRAGLTYTQGANSVTFSGTGSNTLIVSNSSSVGVNASGGTFGGLFSSGSASGIGIRGSSSGVSGVPIDGSNGYAGAANDERAGLQLRRSGIYTGAPGNGIYQSFYTRYGVTGLTETARISAVSRDTSATGDGDLVVYLKDNGTITERAQLSGSTGQLTLPGYAANALNSVDSSLYVLASDATGDVWSIPVDSLGGGGGSGATIDSVFVRNDSIYVTESGTEFFALKDPTGRNTSVPTSFGGDGGNIHFSPRVEFGPIGDTMRHEFPSIAYNPYTRRLVAIFRYSDAHVYTETGRGLAVYSDDFGKTWSDTILYTVSRGTGEDIGTGGISYDHKLRRFLAVGNVREDAIFTDERVLVYSSHDGETWSIYDTIPKPAGTKAFRVDNGFLRLQDNRLATMGYTGDGAGGDTLKVFFIYSEDDGETWTSIKVAQGGTATSNDVNESQLVQKADGTLYVFVRDDDNDAMYRYTSTDKGETWGSAVDVTPSGWSTTIGSRPTLHVFGDSILFWMGRKDGTTYGLSSYSTSIDWGATWTANQLLPQAGAVSTDRWFYGGYCKIDDNSAFLVYSEGEILDAGVGAPDCFVQFFSSGGAATAEQLQIDVVQLREHTPGTLLEGATYYDGTSLRYKDATATRAAQFNHYDAQTSAGSTTVTLGEASYKYEKINCDSLGAIVMSISGGLQGGNYKLHFLNANASQITLPSTVKNISGTEILSITVDSAALMDCVYDGTDFFCVATGATFNYSGPSFSTISQAVDYIGLPYLEINAALETEYSDEAAVDTLHDWSGNARHFAAGAGIEPTYDSLSATSSRPAFKFDGTEYATNTTKANWVRLHSDSVTYFIVAKIGNVSDPNAAYALYGSDGTTSVNIGVNMYYDDRSGVSKNNALSMAANRGVSSFSTFANASANDVITPNVYNSIIHISDPENGTAANRSDVRVNNASAIKNNVVTNAASTSNSTYDFQIGAGGNNVAPFVGEISVFLVWDRILTPAEIAILQTAYENEYGP